MTSITLATPIPQPAITVLRLEGMNFGNHASIVGGNPTSVSAGVTYGYLMPNGDFRQVGTVSVSVPRLEQDVLLSVYEQELLTAAEEMIRTQMQAAIA